jgi:hypothetical protein
VTGVQDAERTVRHSPVSRLARPLRPYAEIFRIPGARRDRGRNHATPPSGWTHPPGPPWGDAIPRTALAPQTRPASQTPRARGAAAPGLVVLAPVYLLLGAMFVSVDLSTVSFAQHFGHKPLAARQPSDSSSTHTARGWGTRSPPPAAR